MVYEIYFFLKLKKILTLNHRTGIYGRSSVGHFKFMNSRSHVVVFFPGGSKMLFQRALAAKKDNHVIIKRKKCLAWIE